ncbi:MAG TPA: T9SS type A sorting domain-containing protein, partial [Adhaeribacter sp.]|nr:T9SS type A sorting domain-containing protein [Adhaeribacter sp.]
NSINVTAGAASGSIMVVATNSCGTSSSSSLAVNITSTPSQPGAITGPASLCQGANGTYSVPSVPGATSYNWTLPSGWTGSSTTNSIAAVAGNTSGSIQVTVTNNCGTSTAQTLAVNSSAGAPAQPGAISGSVNVCGGATATYSVSPVTGADSYTWTLPGGWTGTSTTNSINAVAGTSSGNISVVANNICGSGTAQTLAVNVSALTQPAAITGAAAVCQGATETYTVPAVTGATAYNWTLPTGWTGSSATNSITVTAGTAGGSLSVTATDGTCTSPARNIALTVNPVPAVPTISAAGGVLASSSTSGNQWLLNGNPIPNATSQFYTPAQAGFYTVTVTNANGCTASSAPFSYTTIGMADDYANGIQLEVYPNPAREQVYIKATTTETMQLEVCDLVGKVLMKAEMSAIGGKVEHNLNTASLSKGVYLLNLHTNAGKTTKRLVIQ